MPLPAISQARRDAEPCPPFWASFSITSLCSQIFIAAESAVSPRYPSSRASCLRFFQLESDRTRFLRSTSQVRQLEGCPDFCAKPVSTAPTSTGALPTEEGVALGAAP